MRRRFDKLTSSFERTGPITYKNLWKPIFSAFFKAKTDNFRFKPEMRRRFDNLTSSFERTGPITLENCQKPKFTVLYIGKTGNSRITGHDRFWREIFVSHLKEHHQRPTITRFYWFSSTGFRETDKFRLYRFLSRGHNRNKKSIAAVH